MVFDLTDKRSFRDVGTWWDEVLKHSDCDPKVMLLGNKLDHVENEKSNRRVKEKETRAWAEVREIPYREVSALSGKGVHEALMSLVAGWLRRNREG